MNVRMVQSAVLSHVVIYPVDIHVVVMLVTNWKTIHVGV